MSALVTRSKDAIVATIAAGMQGRVSRFLNFAVGSVFLALAEAHAGVALWLQGEILKVLKQTRAATSEGAELNSWMADFGLARLPAVAATGLVTFGRYTAGASSPVIPVGALVQTGDGSQRYTVYADATVATYSDTAGGYVMPAGAATMVVPVQAVTAGAGGNVAAGAITLVGSSVPGIDVVTNPAGLTNGSDAESDVAFRNRFPDFIGSLSKATDRAIRTAIRNLQLGLRVLILDNRRLDGTFQPGLVTIVVDDGSGAVSDDIVAAARAAVGEVRAAGVQTTVIGATAVLAQVGMTLEVADGYYRPAVVAQVTAALSAYINGLGLGAKLPFSRLAQVAYDASPGVIGVANLSLNGSTTDLVPLPGQTIKAGNLGVG